MATEKTTRTPSVEATIDGTALTLTFANGEVLTIEATDLAQPIIEAATLHGLKQKLVDAAAISRNPDTGASATIEDKYDAVREVHDRITSPNGTWNKIRGDGTGTGSIGLLVRALMSIFGKDESAIRTKLDSLSDDEVKALRSNPKVAAKMAELKAAKAGIDTDALLDGFGV